MSTPPESSSAVFVVADSIKIDAPVNKVWDILLDFKAYNEWNAFVRNQTFVDPKTRQPLPDQTLAVGKHIYMHPVHLPPSLDASELWFWQRNASTNVVVTYLDPDMHRVAWRTTGTPSWLLEAERWQIVTVEEDGKVKYESYEVFKGVLAHVVKLFVGENLKKGVKAMAEGIKSRAEA
ncbi:hypothetical protein Moror_6719 [Moniliophthora roreri MCA 2997]|uniref:Uncharacterized protein n=2 Tax=Moniliophthora roreri TaxID=221103 RepID=V2XSH7_MONRO|nr:hypothetical protein Moror_6719 [Moniliophthora roreri MCA 2997]KAI3612610.1 hypothetical protein WG66_014767 [Moniliophthora roreri]